MVDRLGAVPPSVPPFDHFKQNTALWAMYAPKSSPSGICHSVDLRRESKKNDACPSASALRSSLYHRPMIISSPMLQQHSDALRQRLYLLEANSKT